LNRLGVEHLYLFGSTARDAACNLRAQQRGPKDWEYIKKS
jgi:hypothetical protein